MLSLSFTLKRSPETFLSQRNYGLAATEFFLQRWNVFLADPELLRRAERIEIDRFGHFVMSPPPDALHRKQGFRITGLLEALLPGEGAYPEQSILTSEGIRIADAIWIDPSRLHELSQAPNQPLSPAPVICVEILSPSNSQAEIDQKRTLYFKAGAPEVWVCDRDSHMRFFAPQGQLERSALCPKFPGRIQLLAKAPRPQKERSQQPSPPQPERSREHTGREPETPSR